MDVDLLLKIKDLSNEDLFIGNQRLGRCLQLSAKKQGFSRRGLSTRNIQDITGQLFGVGINKDSVVKINKGYVGVLTDSTLRRLCYVIFKVKYFEFDGDEIGWPVFHYQGEDYIGNRNKQLRLNCAQEVDDLPDLEYRYQDYRDLQRIILGQVDFKERLEVG
jgi:hypothetical protein